jgi:peptide/nickel transport system permease protein
MRLDGTPRCWRNCTDEPARLHRWYGPEVRRLDPWLVAGLTLCGLLLFIAFYGDRIAPNEPLFSVLNVPDRAPYPLPPGDPFLFGSDPAGRDLLSVVLYGARATLGIVVLAGLARLILGAVLASVATIGAVRTTVDALADVVSAVPSTIVAVLIVLVFSGLGAPAPVFIGALLVTGWAGPYRVVRAELARLRSALFTEGARALGARRRDILVRHHLPHLVPVLALAASQQIAAALVALAELGVIGVFVGAVRSLDLFNSLSLVRTGERAGGFVSESSEWSAMLASGRSIENLYVTRWVILVPGIAIAFAVLAVSTLGIGIARQYRRRNLLEDLRPMRVVLVLVVLTAAVLPAFLLPDRDATARDRSEDARARTVVGADVAVALADAGLSPTSFDRTATLLRQLGPASVTVDGVGGRIDLKEGQAVLPVLAGKSSGGVVDAPMVFAGWGFSPVDFPPQHLSAFAAPDFGTAISTWQDDYKTVDVRGKVTVILRLSQLRQGNRFVSAPPPDQLIEKAIAHGATAVILIDSFRAASAVGASLNTYRRMAIEDPISSPVGVPTFVLAPEAADALLQPVGLRATDILRTTNRDLGRDYTIGISMATSLPQSAHVELPVGRVTETAHSLMALTPARPDGHRLVLWAVAPSTIDGSRSAADSLAAVLRGLDGPAVAGLAFVFFDPHGDVGRNATEIANAIGAKIDLVIVLDSLTGQRLRSMTIYDDLFLPVDHYADEASAPHTRTAFRDEPDWPTGLSALGRSKYVLIRGTGPARDDVELRGDAAAMLAFAIARYVTGSPELHQ